jgi:predicted transposase YbfD/YdcC
LLRSRCIRLLWAWRTASQKPDGCSKACCATGENHERAVLRELLGQLDLEGVRIQADALHTRPPFFGQQLQEQGADFLLTVKANQKTLHRQIQCQFQGKRHISFVATDHEFSHGRNIAWTLRAKQAPEHIREAWIGTSWIEVGGFYW